MNSLTFRITCRFAALVTATTAVVLVVGGFVLDREIEHGLEILHDIEVRELTELIGMDGSLKAAEVSNRIKHDTDSDAALFVIQVADDRGNVIFRSDNLGDAILPASATALPHWTATLPLLGRVHLSLYAIGPWRIHIGSLLEPSERVLREYARMGVPLLIGVGIASLGLGYAFSRSTLKPIRAIEATAHRIRADNLAERIPEPSSRDELASLTRLLNQMFDRLQESFEQVQRFAADASHELKTPLSLIRLNVERLRARPGGDADAAAAAGEILEEVGRLNRVIDRLLFLARAESGGVPVEMQPVDMRAMVTMFAEDARALAEDRGVRFAVGRNDSGCIGAEPGLLRQLLLNLVSNAVAVSPAGASVQLDSLRMEDFWLLKVSDEGPGVPEAALSRIFERFVRMPDAAREGGTPRGHGLGLAICRTIAGLHDGSISAENRMDRTGLVVEVKLPVKSGSHAAIAPDRRPVELQSGQRPPRHGA